MNWVIRFRNWLLLGTFVVVIAAIPVANRLTFDQTIESFFPPHNEDIRILKQSREVFGGDEFVIVAWHEPELLQSVPLGSSSYADLSDAAAKRIRTLSERLSAVPGVDGQRTRDLQRMLQKSPRNRNTRNAMLRLFDGILIGPDQQTTAVVLQMLPEAVAPTTREAAIREIRRVALDFIPTASVAGEAVQIQEMFDLVEHDGNVLYLASLVVLMAVLLIIFRNLRWVLASAGIVLASVILTRAMFVLAGVKLSMVSSMLNSLVTIIAIGTTTHIIVHYRELRATLDAEAAALRSLKELWHPVFWTVVTVAAGFAALLVSEINPVRSFAMMMTSGTLMIIVVTFTVLPAAFASGAHVPIPGRVKTEDQLDRILDVMARMIDRHPWGTTILCLLLTAVTAPGLFLMQVETDFSRNFRESSAIVQALKFVESKLGPAGSWDVSFPVPDPLTDEFLDQTRELTEGLRKLEDDGIRLDVLSLSDAVDIPPRLRTAVYRLGQVTRRQADLVESFYNPNRCRMRIVLRSPEQQTTERKIDQIQRVRQVVEEHFRKYPPAMEQCAGSRSSPPTASGLFVLMSHIISSLLDDQMKSFLWACFGTFVCMAIAFRSITYGWISLVPNVFPIALVTGSMGLLQIPVNIGTAMIAAVSMGFTCSVHYFAIFQKALPEVGLTKALQIAQGSAGKAVVLAHIALVSGFMVLTVSEFIPLVYFGAILSLSMIGGLISDLILLPLLLKWTTRV